MTVPRPAALLAAVALAATVPSAPAAAQPEPTDGPTAQIIGGTPAPDDYTFAARLEVAGTGQMVCSAWVHTDRRVVTAAHCVTPLPTQATPDVLASAHTHYGWWLANAPRGANAGTPRAYQVRVGTDATAGQVLRIDQIATGDFAWGMPDADGNTGDVASLRTVGRIATAPAPRWPAPAVGETVRVTGFGRTAPGDPPADWLQMVDTHRVPDTTCPPGSFGRDELPVAPGADGAGAYQGDSGGPLLRLMTVGTDQTAGAIGWTSRAVIAPDGTQLCQVAVDLAAHKRWLETQAARDVEASPAGPFRTPAAT